MLYTDPKGIWAVSTGSDRKSFPVVETALEANSAQFSPDGKWVAYQSLESGQRPEVFVQRFPGPGAKTQISAAGGVQVRWRRDGRELFYLAPDNRLMAVPIRLGADRDAAEAGTPVPLFATRLSGNPQGAIKPACTWSRPMVSAFSARRPSRGDTADHCGPQLEAKSLIATSSQNTVPSTDGITPV